MASPLDDTTMTTSLKLVSVNDSTSTQYTLSEHSHYQNVAQNTSSHEGCMEIRFSEMEYLPWDNPDNIVTADVERTVYSIKNNVLVFLFLIGGPANVINMAVFCKQGLKDRVNLCLFALSLADGLSLTMFVLLHGEHVYFQFITKERYGPVLTFLMNSNIVSLCGFLFVSLILSAIIASERCLCVLSPLKFQTLLHTRTMAVIIIGVYVLALGMNFFVTFRYRIGCIYDPESDLVFESFVIGEVYKAHKDVINFLDGVVLSIGMPGVVMIVVISTTIITTVKLRQIVTWRAGTSSSISPREVALTKMLIGNSIFFIACLCPNALVRFCWLLFPEINSGGRNENFFLTGLSICQILTLINATFNIFVYYAMGSRYRETFWSLFSRKLQSDKT